MSDWRAYDGIAERYDRVWSARFEVVARQLWTLVTPLSGGSVLDIGTGTGIVLKVLNELAWQPRLLVGCDRSARMLERAKEHVPGFLGVRTDATALPISSGIFDIVTASFVFSHVRDYSIALREAFRVLKRTGEFAVSSWAPPSDPYSPVWRECLADAISKQEVERALAEVAPSETHFSGRGRLESALTQAGFEIVRSDTPEFEFTLTVDEFMEDRELSSGGRLGLHLLGNDLWTRFCATTRERLHTTFGSSFRYHTRALIAIARKS